MAELQFPLQYKRQYNAPLDIDMRFDTLASLNAYLTSARRYAGMIVTCLETEGKVYILNNAEDAWVEVSGGGGGTGDMSSSTYDPAGKAEQVITVGDLGSPDGVASLDATGKIETNQLPQISISSVFVVGSEAEQLALVAQEGDVAVRTDEEKTYMKNSGTAGDMIDWTYLATKPDAVLSVNGQTGAVSLASTDLADASSIAYNNTDNSFSANQTYSGTPSFSLDNEIVTKKFVDDTVGVVKQVFTDVKDPTGFVDSENVTIAFDDLTRAVTVSGTFSMYYHGEKIEKSAVSDTVIIDDISGIHFVYYNSVGNLVSTATPISFDNILVSFIYWNSSTQKGRKTNELHTAFRDWRNHEYLHNNLGTLYQSGLAGTFNDLTMEITSGIIWDEDIKIEIPLQNTFSNFYKNGEPTFSWTDLQSIPYYEVAGTIQYNDGNTISSVPNNNYVAVWVFATNDLDSPIITVAGQRVDNQVQNARDNNLFENLSLTDLPFVEYKILYRVIYQRTSGGVQFVEAQDLRAISRAPSSTYVATDHQLLSNRDAENSHPSSAISYDNSISGINSIELKSAIDEIDLRRKNLSGGTVNFPLCVNNGDGTVTIGTSEYRLFPTSDFTGKINKYTIAGGTITVPEDQASYLVADYNSGSPIIRIETVRDNITESDIIPICSFYRVGTDITKLTWNEMGRGLSNKLHRRFVFQQRFGIESGLGLSETGIRNLICDSGVVWYGSKEEQLAEVNTTTTGTIRLWYHNAGVWDSTIVTQYNNTQYDDGTNLVALSSNRYAVNWVFREVDDTKERLNIVLGSGDYKLSEALEETSPPSAPEMINLFSTLVARVIVEQGVDVAEEIQTIQNVNSGFTGAVRHNDTLEKQGGAIDEYYHLSLNEYNNVFYRDADTMDGILDGATYVKTTNDFTDTEKTKLSSIEDGAEVNVQSDWDEVDTLADSFIHNKPVIPTASIDLTDTGNIAYKDQANVFSEIQSYFGTPAFSSDNEVINKKYVDDEISSIPDPAWGEITGTLSNQTDLQNVLDLKANKSNVLELDNTAVFTPDTDYEPATKKYVDDATSSATTEWGDISGTLSNQTDLQTALDGKVSDTGDTINGNLTVNGVINTTGEATFSQVAGDVSNNSWDSANIEILMSSSNSTSEMPRISFHSNGAGVAKQIAGDHIRGGVSVLNEAGDDTTAFNCKQLRSNGGRKKQVDVIATSITLNSNHHVIICDNTVDITVTLPPVASYGGNEYIIKRKNTGNVTIGGTVDGTVNPTIPARYGSYTVISDETNWNFI